MPYFANYGTQDQKDYYMPKLCSGEMVAAIAMTEPGKYSDLPNLIVFREKKHLHNLIRTYTFINF